MAYVVSNGHVTDDVKWPSKCCEAVRSAILATAWLLFLEVGSHAVNVNKLIHIHDHRLPARPPRNDLTYQRGVHCSCISSRQLAPAAENTNTDVNTQATPSFWPLHWLPCILWPQWPVYTDQVPETQPLTGDSSGCRSPLHSNAAVLWDRTNTSHQHINLLRTTNSVSQVPSDTSIKWPPIIHHRSPLVPPITIPVSSCLRLLQFRMTTICASNHHYQPITTDATTTYLLGTIAFCSSFFFYIYRYFVFGDVLQIKLTTSPSVFFSPR